MSFLNGNSSVVIILIFAILLFILYFFPAITAQGRNHRHTTAIWVANLFFGWTFVGWAAVLVWALMNQSQGERQ